MSFPEPSAVVPSKALDAAIERLLVGHPTPRGRRLLGIEYERLILERGTGKSAPVEQCVALMELLVDRLEAEPVTEHALVKGLRAARFEMSLEPGGQFEVAAPPLPRLADVDRVIGEATGAIDAELADTPFELVCVGHAPVTPVSEIGLLPRERYRIMDARMPSRGPLTRNMMRATAGFQLAYDVDDREDAGRKLALLYRLSPVLLALSANSRQIAGADSGFASFRHHVWWETDHDRSGVPAGCLHAETALSGYVEYAKRARVMFLHGEDDLVAAPDLPLAELVAKGQITEADLDLHLSGLFPFVRLRNYIEVRCFDSMPWELTRSVMALVSGLVYCNHAFAAAWELSGALLVEDPDALRALHEDAARRGLDARAPDGSTFAELARRLVSMARATLGGESCDWAEPSDLDAIAEHIEGVRLLA